jgi:flagellar FliL protein
MSDAQAPAKKSPKMLVLLVAAVLLLAGGGGAWWFLQKKNGDDGDDEARVEKKHAAKPLFTTLETFTVNLSDPRGDRFAQVGVTLQFEDPKLELEIKDHMPAIRNEILLLISSKQIEELLTVDGKLKLAQEIRVKTGRALGVDLPDLPKAAPADAAGHDDADEDEPKPKKKGKRKKAPEVVNPITQVLFSQFIVQ